MCHVDVAYILYSVKILREISNIITNLNIFVPGTYPYGVHVYHSLKQICKVSKGYCKTFAASGVLNYLLNKFDTSEKIHTEINEGPHDALFGILFLFQYEHVMVKELLQFFIGKVNTQLFKTVELHKNKGRTVKHLSKQYTVKYILEHWNENPRPHLPSRDK